MYYIGIDLGTSGLKGLLVDGSGKILKEASASYPVSYPEKGWSEQNPEDWLGAAIDVLHKLSHGVEKDIRGVSIGGQMHGLVILDENDKVIRPAILWNDGRAKEEVEYLNSLPLTEYTGNIAFAGFTAPKIIWVKKHEPENFAKINKLCLPKDYLAYKLTGVFSTDYSDASGMLLLDVKEKRWSNKMLEICSVKEEWLPKLYESYAVTGKVNCLPDAVMTAGAGDNAAAAIGTGTVKEGDCNISLGTSGTLFIASEKFNLPKNNALHSFAHANGKYHLMGCILSAASANKWWIEDISGENYNSAEKAEKVMGKNGVYFLPYLSGERCPHNDVNASGAFVGLSANTGKEEMSLAVLEGVAFALRDCLELARNNGVSVAKSTVCGGGAKSKLWLKIISNVLNVELQTVETEQGPAFGAAILAMVGCGEYEGTEQAAKAIVKKSTVSVPDGNLVRLYNEHYKKYKKLYPLLKDWYSEN